MITNIYDIIFLIIGIWWFISFSKALIDYIAYRIAVAISKELRNKGL